ncbi:MAG: hypothetical protein JF614_13820 [Acidobacteria bacterium]|nr:hypothetical protein [Acidobacteriota bacterium]
MEHVWTLFCKRAIIDRESNQVSLIDAIETVLIDVSPTEAAAVANPGEKGTAIELEATLFSFWVRSRPDVPEMGAYRVSLVAADGSLVLPVNEKEMTARIDLTEKQRVRTQIKMTVLPFRGVGRYTFQMEQGQGDGQWEVVARVPYELTFEQPSTAP